MERGRSNTSLEIQKTNSLKNGKMATDNHDGQVSLGFNEL